jgi:5-hydroxyisourate hydrolase
VPVSVDVRNDSGWLRLAASATGADGRIADFPALDLDKPATCRLVFDVGGYLGAEHGTALFPEVILTCTLQPAQHYHLPLLLTPFGYTVYRGS